jgi:hypothetical protein
MQATSLVEVDAVEYPVHFEGFHQPLHVWLRGEQHVSLRPWTCGEHLAALGRHLKPGASGVTLDTAAFSGEVLAREGLTGALAQEIAPLALWWAAGGGVSSARPGPEGWLELESCRVQLRPWTAGERLQALARCVRGEGSERSFEVGRYLEAMLEASVKAVEPAETALRALDAASTVALLEAVVALNVPGEEEGTLLGSPEVAATTLRLCRELGWTPTQVWATPAPEVDRLLRLLDAAQGASAPRSTPVPRASPSPRPHGSRLADHPDAIVIQIEDDSP